MPVVRAIALRPLKMSTVNAATPIEFSASTQTG